MWLRNRKIVAVCPKKVSQRCSDGHLGEAEDVNQTFLSSHNKLSEYRQISANYNKEDEYNRNHKSDP